MESLTMRPILLFVLLAPLSGCTDRSIGSDTDGGLPDLTEAPDLHQTPDLSQAPDLFQPPPANSCAAAGGLCIDDAPGCPAGYRVNYALDCGGFTCCTVDPMCHAQQNQASCQAAGCQWMPCPPGVACPRQYPCNDPDCRTLGCPSGTSCQSCWSTYDCLPPNVAC
jgi:hypothetical protein